MIIQDKKLAEFAGRSVGTILSKEEGIALLDAYHQHVAAVDNGRFNDAVKTASKWSRIVTKTWSRDGRTLRRGDVIFVKKGCDGFGACMVTRSESRTAQGTVWTCGWDEVREHSTLAISLKEA